MTVKKIFTALVFLISLCWLMGFVNLSSVGFQETKAAAFDLGDPTQAFSCADPSNQEDQAACADMEAHILASTIRIELLTWGLVDGHHRQLLTESHATILSGKTLVTHNHFKYSLTDQVTVFGDQSGYAAVSLRDTYGRLLLEYDDLTAFKIF